MSDTNGEPIPSPMQPGEDGTVNEVAPAEAPVDLDKQRDDHCFPVARAMFAKVVEDLIPAEPSTTIDFTGLTLDLLQKGLDADLNITMEVPYVFQLMLGILSGLNKTIQAAYREPMDEVRYARIARQILSWVAEANVTIGSVTPDQTVADFASVKDKIDTLFKEEKLNLVEIKYIMDTIFESFTAVNNSFMSGLESSSNRAEGKLWGVGSTDEVTMGMMDKVLKI